MKCSTVVFTTKASHLKIAAALEKRRLLTNPFGTRLMFASTKIIVHVPKLSLLQQYI